MTCVDESQTRRTTKRLNHCVSCSIKASMSGRKRLIDRVSSRKIFRVIISSIPWNIPFFRTLTIYRTNSGAFPATQLLQRQPGYIFIWKSHTVHLTYYTQAKPERR